MRDLLIAAISRQILSGGEAMGKGIAVDFGSHEAKEKASQKLALLIAIVKLFLGPLRAYDHGWAYSFCHCPVEIALGGLVDACA
jgi:hypothetical protein